MASTAELKLEIGLVDKASSGLGKIAGALGGLAKLGGTALLGGAVAGVGALSTALVGGIADARAANIVMAQTEAVIASTGGAAGVSAEHVSDLAASLSAASGKSLFGDDMIQESSNLLLTFTNLKGETLDLATAMSVDMAQALGGAPADAAVQLGKALNDPIAGISALSRVGVTFSEDQKAVIASLMETGDVAGAQQVILAELNKEFGGSAAAAAAADGGVTMFKDRMGELAESIGSQVLPLLNQFMAWLNSPEIQTAITNIGTGLVNAVVAAAAGFTSFMTAIEPVVGFVRDNLVGILSGLATMLIAVVVPAFTAWAATAGAAALATITALAPVLIPIAAIGAAVALLVTAWDRDWGGIRTTLTTFWDTYGKPTLEAIRDWIEVTLPTAIDNLKAGWDIAWAAIKLAVETARDGIETAIDTIKTFVSDMKTEIGARIDDAVQFFKDLPGDIMTAVSNFPSLLLQAGKDLINGLIDGIKSIDVGTVLGNVVSAGIAAAKAVVGIKSPSTKTRDEIGIPLVQGVIVGIEKEAPNLRAAAAALGEKIPAWMTEGVEKAAPALIEAVKQPPMDAIKEVIRDVKLPAQGAGIAVAEGIAEGYTGATGLLNQTLIDTLTGSIHGASDAALAALNQLINDWNAAMGRIKQPGGGLAPDSGGPITRFRAAGGPVSAGMPYIVGERGPERFVPRQSGTIVPNDQLGGNINITINAGSGSVRDIQLAVERALDAKGYSADRRTRMA